MKRILASILIIGATVLTGITLAGYFERTKAEREAYNARQGCAKDDFSADDHQETN